MSTLKEFKNGDLSVRVASLEELKQLLEISKVRAEIYQGFRFPISIICHKNGMGFGFARLENDISFKDFFADINPAITEHLIKDNKVIIKLSNGRVGVAKCNPDDKFDIATGTELAVKRAYGIEKEDKPFKVGDKVRYIGEMSIFNLNGKKGTIIGLCGRWLCVELDNDVKGHDCDGMGKGGYCLYILPKNLKLIGGKK